MHKNKNKTTSNLDEVIVVGGGWSGLACAITLSHHGYKVTILESARQIGGRARAVNFKSFISQQTIDNGQHIMLGAYHSTLELFKLIGIHEDDFLERQSLELNLYSKENPLIQLKSPQLPAPLHLISAFINISGLSYYDRYKIIKMSLILNITGYKLKHDVSVRQLLSKHSQSEKVISALWEPLCLATMNTPIKNASGQVFLNVLKDSFSKKNSDSDLLFFRHNLSEIFCNPASTYITKHNGRINCEEKVLQIEVFSESKENTVEFNIKTRKQSYKSQNIVIATPAHICNKFIQSFKEQLLHHYPIILKPDNASLLYKYEPICTVYIQYPSSVTLTHNMIGLFNTTSQWAIDRSLTHQPGLIAVIISGPGLHIKMEHHLLVKKVHEELSFCIPNLPNILDSQVIIEKKATFSCQVNIESQRPQNTTKIPGLFLAGDYTNTHYPSTLEGAVRSGQRAAKLIIDRNSPCDFTL
ncbi:MAG: hydroxysqualene dehydroxylase HpnE [Gammaproteobacteria bacterium]|nr:hydroxysqualene dehydroxylase HpnE [Gammaproteobacteria bacterium]